MIKNVVIDEKVGDLHISSLNLGRQKNIVEILNKQ